MKLLSKCWKWFFVVSLLPVASFAAETAEAVGHAGGNWIAPAIGFGIGIAVLGGALGQGRIAASFMEGVSRNPGAVNFLRTPLILALVFVETLVLFTVLIMFLLLGKM